MACERESYVFSTPARHTNLKRTMELKGEQLIQLELQTVWAGLNDIDILKAAIPGCESIDKTGDTDFNLVLVAAVGPVKARFNGKLALSDICPPESYTLNFEGSGGAAGFGKGQAQVVLARTESGTLLSYTANAQVGGKIAQVGSRLIDGVAAKMAAEFFTRFKAALVLPEQPEVAQPEVAQPEARPRWKLWGR
jgi:carbon monoxide dehydrogenase subunit G